jgi:hypothetical protein
LVLKFLDLEFETDVQTTAPEPALYETAYVTSHKGNCRAGAFSVDGQLIATGSVDASIKASIWFFFKLVLAFAVDEHLLLWLYNENLVTQVTCVHQNCYLKPAVSSRTYKAKFVISYISSSA